MSFTEKTPCILIPGFGQSKAFLQDGDNTAPVKVWPLGIDVKKAAKRIAPSYIKTVFAGRDAGFTDTAYDMFCEVFEPFSFDDNGRPKHNLFVPCDCVPVSEYKPKAREFVYKIAPLEKLAETVGEDSIYCFSYNAFDDPRDTAEKLDEFIEEVCRQKNTQKVNLVCFSMGGTVAAAYFAAYSEKAQIERAVFVAGCLGGSAIQESILLRDVDRNMGYSLLGFISGNSAVKTFKRVLSLTKWDVRYALLFRSLDAVQDTLLNTSPGMWGMLPADVLKEQSEIILAEDKYKELKTITDGIYGVISDIPDILKKTEAQSTEIFLIAGYGSRIMPLCANGSLNTDGILDIRSAAPGTTAAPLGEKLQQGAMLSPDGQIDASTCIFPDRTWYFEGETHATIGRSEKVKELVNGILGTGSVDGVNTEFERFG